MANNNVIVQGHFTPRQITIKITESFQNHKCKNSRVHNAAITAERSNIIGIPFKAFNGEQSSIYTVY